MPREIEIILYVPSPARNGELILIRAPSNEGSSTVQPQSDQCWLPDSSAGQCIRCLLPNIRVPVLRSSNYTVRMGGPINGCDDFVVLFGLRVVSNVNRYYHETQHTSESVSTVFHSLPCFCKICASLELRQTASSGVSLSYLSIRRTSGRHTSPVGVERVRCDACLGKGINLL